MYEAFFGLACRPFAAVPRVDHYYPGETIEGARETVARSIERAEGVGMVVGPSGTGKSLLLAMLAEQFRESFQVALLSNGRLSTRRALFQAILFELGRPYREMDEGDLRLAMVDHLTTGEDCPNGMLLLIDEAHTLPMRLLDEIRMVTNLVLGGQPAARLVLAGGPLLEERFASPKLDSFNQRIVARCYLESFNREETQGYIHAQLGTVEREGEPVLSDDASYAVYQATDGVPRLINQVCDHALLLAYAAGRSQVDRTVIEEAWADLQQLPAPWNGDGEGDASEGGTIEFGGLDDEPDETEETADRQEAPLPMLRISPDSGESAADPAEQIERIEQAISGLADDFQPAGSIGPEVELVFHDSQDPFGEEFEEEEIVVDRFEAAKKADSEEHATTPPGEDSVESDSVEPDSVEPAALEKDDEEVSQDGAGATDDREHFHEPREHEARATWEAELETVPMHRSERGHAADGKEAAEAGEEDLIIVEESCDDAEPAGTHSLVPVRRREYAQLFARLRRTS